MNFKAFSLVCTIARFHSARARLAASPAEEDAGAGLDPPAACGSGTLLETYDFEDDTVPLDITGNADRPWDYGDRAGEACSGSMALTAGFRQGVNDVSVLSITAPPGTTSLTYFYSYPSQLDPADDFHVLVNDVLVNFYELGPGEKCASACIFLSGGDVVKFRCATGRRNEICTIDNLQFFGSTTTTTSTTTAASTTTTTSATTAASTTTTSATTTAASKAPTDVPTKKPTDAPTKKPTDTPTTTPTPPTILLETYDFEDDTVPLDITGNADRPWDYDDRAGEACSGSMALTAGFRQGVDDVSVLSIVAPPGTTSLTYFYSYPSQLDPQDDFHVLVNDVLVNSYEFGPGETCASASIFLSGGDVVKFKCATGRRNEICTIDNLQFFGVRV